MLARLDSRLQRHCPAEAAPLGWRCFQLGILLLASSALLAGLALVVALLLGSRGRQPPLADRANLVLLVAGALMLLGALGASSGGLAWAGLANWLPFFWAFWGFQPYLASAAARRRVALLLVAGTVPVIVTGLGQLWWGWQGPFQALGGLIIWHLHPGGNPPGRLAGLFDYANIAGAWLAMAWPLLLAALLQPGLRKRSQAVLLLLAVGLAVAVFLTDSRNAWGALVLALPLTLGPLRWPWLLPLLGAALVLVVLATVPGVPAPLQGPARWVVPEAIWARLNDLQYANRPLAMTRMAQWTIAAQMIGERPWLGWGAAAFIAQYK
ncbi:MAG: O-antigen ligase family protein, partial [Synechococcaceae cyanobacterium]|nr:O-antigen ligase family protein [Synechococcaceae cyanobacterium]